MKTSDDYRMKVVGKRRPGRGGIEAAAGFLELVIALRGNKPFIPKGVHRFKTFEESEIWTRKMMARRRSTEICEKDKPNLHF